MPSIRDEIDLIKRTKASHSWSCQDERRATLASVHERGGKVSVILKRPNGGIIAVYWYPVGELAAAAANDNSRR